MRRKVLELHIAQLQLHVQTLETNEEIHELSTEQQLLLGRVRLIQVAIVDDEIRSLDHVPIATGGDDSGKNCGRLEWIYVVQDGAQHVFIVLNEIVEIQKGGEV